MNEKLSTVCEHKEMMTDDVIAAIVRLLQTHENLLIEADRINRAIDDLKRVREMARALGNDGKRNE